MNAKALFTAVLLFITCFVNAQQFGAFPPSTHWRQIQTDTARIIYEGATTSQAQNIAAIIHQANRINATSLGNNVRRINIEEAKGWRGLFYFGLFNVVLVAINNYIYHFAGSLYWLPLVQKITFLSFLVWVCCVTIRLYRLQKGEA